MAFPAQNFEDAVSNAITSSDQLYNVINGLATEVVATDNGDIPTLRKALVDNFYFRDPIAWVQGANETVFNQLRSFTDGTWWYAPAATATNILPMGVTPYGDSNWVLSNIRRVDLVQPLQFGDGVLTTFNSPVTGIRPDASFKVTLDGIDQHPTDDYICNANGTITIMDSATPYVVPLGVKVSIILMNN